jgi:ubiquinol-cytochrome c reductase cytochrome b subunit
MIVQVVSGFLLACFYVRGELGWTSVVEITREVNSGWLIRVIHGNTASFVFLILFIHFFRGLRQRSFYLWGPWLSGFLIKVLIMASAFLGYVLPWGQMSFWGATVIINLLRVLPKGKMLVIWLWGGFYVSSFTCRFFYAFHFLLPLIVIVMVVVHLIFLHFRGSSVFGGIRRFNGLMIKFSHLFSYKDIINLIGLWIILLFIIVYPDWSADPINFSTSDLSRSPIHIQPEWYFLHLYAVLRSIPNKLGGLIGFFSALVIIVFLVFIKRKQAVSHIKIYNYMFWLFLATNFILLWLGIQPVEEPFIFIGQTITLLYFLYFREVFILDIYLSGF